jgi:transposase-like protein
MGTLTKRGDEAGLAAKLRSPPETTYLIVKYLTELTDYKQYCERGKGNNIPKPQVCPYCGRKDCLKGHGWYRRKGLSGHSAGFLSFFIKRFRCTETGRTVSMHPTFSHTRKRYTLQSALDAAGLLSNRNENIRSASRRLNIYRSSVSRWRSGFFNTAEAAKWACFYHGDLPRPFLLKELLSSMFKCSLTKAAQEMSNLKEQFNDDLY